MQRTLGVRRALAAFAGTLLATATCASGALAAGPVASATRVGSAPANTQLSLVLPLRTNEAALTRFANAVSTPGSSQYGDYQSLATLSRRFGASASERARVVGYLRAAGASDVTVDPTGIYVSATLRVATAERLFGETLASFRSDGATEQSYIAPRGATHVPAALSGDVTGVVGLDTQPLASSTPAQSAATTAAALTPLRPSRGSGATTISPDVSLGGTAYAPRTGTAAGCPAGVAGTGFTPNQWNSAYGIAPLQVGGVLGQGVRVALIEIDGFKPSDITTWDRCFDIPAPHVNLFGVGGITKPLKPGGETTLDLEVLTSVAQKLKAIDVYESSAKAVDVLRALTAPLHNRGHHPDVISASLGNCEQATNFALGKSGVNAVGRSLKMAAANGVSILAAAGDDGSTTCADSSGPLKIAAVSFPASSPWVTGVGGTNVMLDANNNITASTVWNDGPDQPAAGGGGYSRVFTRPSWQKGFTTARHRVVPDVSMLADLAPGYDIYCTARNPDCLSKDNHDPWIPIGGTSAASPLLAGGFALVDEVLHRLHRHDLGFANPLLYKLDHSAVGPSVFSDVTSGSNDLFATVGHPVGCCIAGPGFDPASGLGQVNVLGLAEHAPSLVTKK